MVDEAGIGDKLGPVGYKGTEDDIDVLNISGSSGE
jgi:hypothetical protein